MRYVAFIVVAICTFVIGVISHSVVRLTADKVVGIAPVSQLRQDKLHRLYEAAGMSGDYSLLTAVHDRFLCIGWDDSLDARLVNDETDTYCVERDGSVRPPLFRADKSKFDALLKGHIAWSIENLEFVESVKNPRAAREYVATHLPR